MPSNNFDDYVKDIIDNAPVDELLALMAAREHAQRQYDEDTCTEHGVWCCDKCFDMRPFNEAYPEDDS